MYEILCGCVESLWRYVEIGWKHYYFISGCIFYRISLIYFYDRVLFSLRNPCTKFRAAVLSRFGDMLKIGWNSTISFPGAFFIRFLWFFFINVFYLAYEIHVQNFVQLCCVVVEICWKWVEISILWLLWISFIVSLLFACIWGFIIIKGVTNIYNIYKCYEHFNYKMIRIFLWDGMDGKKCIWMMFHPIQQLLVQDFHIQKSCDHGKKSVMEAKAPIWCVWQIADSGYRVLCQ